MSDDSSKIESILQQLLDELLAARVPPKTICPSEVPRKLTAGQLEEAGVSSWRDLMDDTRKLAWQMRASGEVEILQGGEVVGHDVGLDDIKGPIRLRRTA
ncbi:MAG: hypothetical protein M1833_005183 [Piccolia ochrophora]|nr:MAG: hypothetical protein M1833_005183 [Piccolia ochrophora]